MSPYIHPSSHVGANAIIGDRTKVWHFSHVMDGAVIGEDCSFGQNVFIGSGVKIGNRVKVQNNVSLYDGVVIEDDVFIGPSAVFTNVINPRAFIVRKSQYAPTIVGKGCSIGANSTIVCGNSLGSYAFIGAGAVVTKPVLPFALMLGVPAQICGWVSKAGHTLVFDIDNKSTCPETGENYQLFETPFGQALDTIPNLENER